MVDVNEVTKAVARQARLKSRQMDLEHTEAALIGWLAGLKFPNFPNAESWADILQTYPRTEDDYKILTGVKVRFSIQLYTKTNQYLLSLMECMAVKDAGHFILTVHVNWHNRDRRKQKTLEESYGGHFDGLLRAKHTIWAQTFKDDELVDALNSAGVAILGHELVGQPPVEKVGEQVKPTIPTDPSFPSKKDSI